MKRGMITVILAMVLAFSAIGWAAEPPMMEKTQAGKTQAACPVLGNKVNKDLYVDYKGQRIYFCCPQCIPVFQKDPEKYLQKMREQGVYPEPIPGSK